MRTKFYLEVEGSTFPPKRAAFNFKVGSLKFNP